MHVIDAKIARESDVAREVAELVESGGIVIFPTDTVYGIGCDPRSERAVERIFAAKRRPADKPLSLHFGNVAAILRFVDSNELAKKVAETFFPGPLTLIVERPASVATFVTRGRDTVGLRVPDYRLCSAILEASGPIAATSANVSGFPAYTGRGPVTELPEADVLVDDGPTKFEAESTIIDVTGARPKLVREGAITLAMLEDKLGSIEGNS
jgi:L-threonylcarbamoyladenylate synthase